MGSSTQVVHSGTCQLTPCDKPDYSVWIHIRDGKQDMGGFQIDVSHLLQPLQNGYLVGMRINTMQVGPSINGASILSTWGQGKIYQVPWPIFDFISAVGEHRVLQST